VARRALLIFFLALVVGCGGADPQPREASEGRSEPVRPLAANLLDASSLEPIDGRLALVPANGRRELEFDFGTATVGSVIVLTDKHDDLKAAIGGVRLRTGDLFGAPADFLVVSRPGRITLTLENEGPSAASVSVQFLAKTTRKIELDVEPKAVQPAETVTLTATVSEPTAADIAHVLIRHQDTIVAELEPERVSATTWRTSYRAPEAAGFYAVSARVDGGPPREMRGITGFEVAHRGTRVTSFDELTRDTDRDGLIDWLVIRLHVTISIRGTYVLTSALTDSAGVSLPVGGGNGDVLRWAPGRHILELRWSGASLRATGTPGPYGIAHVQLTRVEPSYRTETDITELGKTRAYNLTDLDPDEP
jgi:hypothetical protein